MSRLNYSYFYELGTSAEDEGAVAHFSFFTEINRPLPGLGELEAIILVLLFLLSTAANAVLIFHLCRHKGFRTVTNFFVCNLALADLLFTSVGPFLAVGRIMETWVLGGALCRLLPYIEMVCGFVMVWTMAAISIDRYKYVMMNKFPTRQIPKSLTIVISVAIWLILLLIFTPIAIFFQMKDVKHGDTVVKICTLVWPQFPNFRISLMFTMIVLVIGFLIPFGIICINYSRIFRKYWNSRQNVDRIPSESDGYLTGRTTLQREKRSRQRLRRIIKTWLLLVGLFLLMWSPIFVVFMVIQYYGSKDIYVVPSYALVLALIVAYINACINPVIYGFMNVRIRKSLKSVFKSFKGFHGHSTRNFSHETSSERKMCSLRVSVTSSS
ncbi:hypothetical protein ACJMK2_006361 [Sinanodonta woodiana]|uniref:G-protein coupled receptors family 1 profile domain-containing protein n=1 Tax=Sinanodonta woodiana TaxID=1069815 RepID=A0ABD3VU99_SINWO